MPVGNGPQTCEWWYYVVMAELSAKHVLIVGDKDKPFDELAKTLLAHGMDIHSSECSELTPEMIKELKIDLILLNHLHEGEHCKEMLRAIKKADLPKVIPTFILVPDSNEKIQEALSMGATDYVTVDEEQQSILQKIHAIFGEDNSGIANGIIDITPPKMSLTETGIRVFVIEDDPLLRNLLSIKLEKSSFPCEFSSDGKGALTAMRAFKPDVVILDLMLPGISGLEVLAEIKGDHSLKNVPVIVFSNRDGQGERKKAQELGASGFYIKAMTDLSELVQKIEGLAK